MSDARGSFDVYTINADGSDLRRLTDDPAQDLFPTWSPDGKRVAFASDRTGDFDIYVMNADGTAITDVTHSLLLESHPAWSPDGTLIAFTRETNAEQVFVVRPDGTGLRQVSHAPEGGEHPSWSPDGQRIAFSTPTSTGPVGRIYSVNLDGSDERPILQDGRALLTLRAGAWSPDGKRLVFTRAEGANASAGPASDISAITIGSTAESQLTDGGLSGEPSWAPQGGLIVFHNDRNSSAISFMDLQTGTKWTLAVNLAHSADPEWTG